MARRGSSQQPGLTERADNAAVRPAVPADAEAIAAIHGQGIEERVATFETRTPEPGAISTLISHGALYLVCERDGVVIGFAKLSPYEDQCSHYDGIGEATVYVDRGARRTGTGRTLLSELLRAARGRGKHKVTAKVMAANEASLGLFEGCGFRVVGTHRRHGELDGEWLDVVVLERSL